MGFHASNSYYSGPSGGSPSRDDGYIEKPPSSGKDGPSSSGGSASGSSDGNREVRSVSTHEGRFRSTLGAFQDFFSLHSSLPHEDVLSYFSPGDKRVHNDAKKVTDAGRDVTVEVVEADESSAQSESEEHLSGEF